MPRCHSIRRLLLAAIVSSVAGQTAVLSAQEALNAAVETRLDPLLELPAVFEMTQAELEATFSLPPEGPPGFVFRWLTRDKSRAQFTRRSFGTATNDLTLFGGSVKIEEAIVDFKNGRFYGLTISILNRGDSGHAALADFTRRKEVATAGLSEILNARPTLRRASPSRGFLTEGWTWVSHLGMAVLEHNPEAPEQVEFLRMRLTGRHATGVYGAAIRGQSAARVRLAGLTRNVRRDGKGNVFIEGVPMVDQGGKGYCVVASVQRVFEYYGIPCDQHQLAQVTGADPDDGTSVVKVREELRYIDEHFKTRFDTLAGRFTDGKLYELKNGLEAGREVPPTVLKRKIKTHVDAGIPLLWSLDLAQIPADRSIPSRQNSGGHMRLIIGYNDRTNDLIYTDSWGAGHEFKAVGLEQAIAATHALFVLEPVTR